MLHAWALVLGLSVAAEGYDHTYAAFDRFLEGAVDDSGVRYDLLASRRALLDAHLAQVAAAPVATFSREEQLALYVNAYNGYTLLTMLDAMPIASIRELDGGKVWSTRTFAVGGGKLTLDAMEHERARKLTDGRVHAVVNCASRGCPPLPPDPLTPGNLERSLDEAARRWVRVNAASVQGSTVRLSKIFSWYAADFTKWGGVDLPNADASQDAAIGFLRAFGGSIGEVATVGWAEYDWALNTAKR
jgi:hypothetical protein